MGGHAYRRAKFEPMLVDIVSKVSPCFAYRGKKEGESDQSYVQRLALELDLEFQRIGPESVCAFVAEPVVGAVSEGRSLHRHYQVCRLTLVDRPWDVCQLSLATSKPCKKCARSMALCSS